MCVCWLNTLNVTGQWYLPSPFLWNCSRIRSVAASGAPVTGCRRNFLRYGTMLRRSKTTPSAVHIGVSNGRNEIAQQSKGSVLYGMWKLLCLRPTCADDSELVK